MVVFSQREGDYALHVALHRFLGRYPRAYHLSLGVALCFFVSMHLLVAPIPLYVTHLGGGAVAVGLAGGLFAGVALLARAPVGWLSDRVRRWWLLLAGCGIYLAASLAYLAVSTVPAVLVVRALHGVGISAFTTGYTALAADLAPSGRRGEALGLAGTAGPVSLLFAPAVGDWVRLHLGYGPAFLLAAAAALGGIALLLLLPRGSGHAPEISTLLPPGERTRRRDLHLSVVFGLATCGITYSALYGFLPAFAVERDQNTVGFFFVAFAGALIGARVLLGRASDRWGRRLVIVPALAVMAFSLWVVAATQNWMWLVAAGLLAGMGQGAARAVLEAAAVDGVEAGRRGRALNASWLGFDLGITLGSLAWGPVAEALGYGPMFGVVGAVGFLFVAAFTVWYRG